MTSVTIVVKESRRGRGQGSGLRAKHRWNIGQQWYVDALNGSDITGNGSSGKPWRSLQRAADYLRTRATWPRRQDVAVNIRPTAAYKAPATEQATLWTDFSSPVRAPASNRYVIWRVDPAYPGRAHIVNPDGASGNKIGVILGSSRLNSYQVFSGLDLDGERVRKGSGRGSVLAFYLSGTAANANTHVEILNTKIHGFRATLGSGNTAQGVFADDGSSYLLFDRVEVYDIGVADDPVNNTSHGLYLQSHHNQITNSIFRDNPNGFGIQLYSGGAVSMNGTTVANVTMNNNGASGLLLHGDASDVELKNLITTNHRWNGNSSWGILFYPAPSGAARGSVLDHVLYYNDYMNRSGKPAGWRISNERTADPRYANAGAGDLHLLAGSPALGYTDTVFSPAVDRDGVPRPRGAEDAGAFERRVRSQSGCRQ